MAKPQAMRKARSKALLWLAVSWLFVSAAWCMWWLGVAVPSIRTLEGDVGLGLLGMVSGGLFLLPATILVGLAFMIASVHRSTRGPLSPLWLAMTVACAVVAYFLIDAFGSVL